MYELIILSLLMRGPCHGYLIVKMANELIGPWAKISSGTLYPLLNRMRQAGVIITIPSEDGQENDRKARTFLITEEGLKRFHHAMTDISSNLGDYPKIFHYKMAFIDLLASEERILLFNHYVNYCQVALAHLQTETASLVHDQAQEPYQLFHENMLKVQEHVERQTQKELEWVMALRAEELVRIEALSVQRGFEALAQGVH
jgi:DNA-binding PadR family transcriptional regulator